MEPIIGLHPWDLFPTELIAPSGDSYLYMAFDAGLLEPEPNGTFDLYESSRASAGWITTRRLSPSGTQAIMPDAGGVSAEHDYAFTYVAPVASETGSLSEGNYLGKPDGTFELVGLGALGSEPYAQGRYISPGGDHVIFSTGTAAGGVWCAGAGGKCLIRQLEDSAPPTGTPAVYDRSPSGSTHVISLLPGGVPLGEGEAAAYQGVSADGSAVAFKVSGTLYVRIDNTETRAVTESPSTFAGLSATGNLLFYLSGGNIYRFDTSNGGIGQVNSSGDAQIVNISADGSHIYFVSPSQLDGAKGTVGQPNLYVWNDEAVDFIATLLPSDLERTSGNHVGYPALGNWTKVVTSPDNQLGNEGDGPGANSSRATPDGKFFAFESRAQLTGYPNAGHTEIYRYNYIAKTLKCVSCNPMASVATGDARFEELTAVYPGIVIHNLSEDGRRVFFETSEALVSQDTDGINDIYEWQEGPFSEGIIDLISSGKSVEYPSETERASGAYWLPNTIFSISPTGSDVVFGTLDQLLPTAGAGGVQAIYDARANGGFVEPTPVPGCTGSDGCQGPSGQDPALGDPRSDQVRGDGNVKPRQRRCRHVKHRKTHRPRSCRRHRTKRAVRK